MQVLASFAEAHVGLDLVVAFAVAEHDVLEAVLHNIDTTFARTAVHERSARISAVGIIEDNRAAVRATYVAPDAVGVLVEPLVGSVGKLPVGVALLALGDRVVRRVGISIEVAHVHHVEQVDRRVAGPLEECPVRAEHFERRPQLAIDEVA